MEQPRTETLPSFFEPLLAKSYSPKDVERIVDGCAKRKTTLRSNALKATCGEIEGVLREAGIGFSHPSWYADAFVIEGAREDAIRALAAYEEGKVYLQSLSSMLPPLALEVAPGTDILDMCAAPGGKTTQIAAIGGRGTHVTACEMSAPRADKLEHNLAKQGCGNVTVLRQDARRLDGFFRFDRILVDAPCSGSGTIRAGDAKMLGRFTPKLVDKCAKQQAALLDKALSLLKPGGLLVYSTCSVIPRENEDQLVAALKRARKKGAFEVVPLGIAGDGEIPTLPNSLPGSMTVCPTETYEGFFLAKVKRTG